MRFLFTLFHLFILTQFPANFGPPAEGSTTFILVRHAEKERSGNDPELSSEGKQRAKDLSMMLGENRIDAIYSTPFKRTRQTILPLAELKNLPIKEYSASMPYVQFINKLSGEHRGKVILIAGHSNTIPEMLKVLSKGEFNINIEENEYDNLFIVTGTKEAHPTVLHLKYGKPTAK